MHIDTANALVPLLHRREVLQRQIHLHSRLGALDIDERRVVSIGMKWLRPSGTVADDAVFAGTGTVEFTAIPTEEIMALLLKAMHAELTVIEGKLLDMGVRLE